MSYLVSLVVFLAGVCFTVFTSGSTTAALLYLPSFIAVGIVPFLFVSVLFGFKNMGTAFSTALKKEAEKEKAQKAVDFFKFYGKTIWVFAVIAAALGFIGMLYSLEDASQIGPKLALAVVSLLYAGIINAVIVLPFTILAKKQLAD